MSRVAMTWQARFDLTLTDLEWETIRTMARQHYDLTCRQEGQRIVESAKAFEPNDPKTARDLSSRDLDLLCKIFETIEPDRTVQRRLQDLLHRSWHRYRAGWREPERIGMEP